MRIIGIVSTIFLMHLASAAWPAVSFQCYPNLEVAWSFDHKNNQSEFHEKTDNLPSITLYLDTGFLKLPTAQNNGAELFRQQAIENQSENPLDIVVKYESTNKMMIETTVIILSDPLCKRFTNAVVSIFTAAEFRNNNIIYNCDCLSSTRDAYNFTNY
jgi:hypothetical protein